MLRHYSFRNCVTHIVQRPFVYLRAESFGKYTFRWWCSYYHHCKHSYQWWPSVLICSFDGKQVAETWPWLDGINISLSMSGGAVFIHWRGRCPFKWGISSEVLVAKLCTYMQQPFPVWMISVRTTYTYTWMCGSFQKPNLSVVTAINLPFSTSAGFSSASSLVMKCKTKKCPTTHFLADQLKVLEQWFLVQQYPTSKDYQQLGGILLHHEAWVNPWSLN